MSEGWRHVPLSSLIEAEDSLVAVEPETTYPIVGVLNRGRGLLWREPIRGSDTKYRTLRRVHADRVIFSKLKAFEGAITVTPPTMQPAYASQEFPTFVCGPELLPAYFRLLTSTPQMWEQLKGISTGMGGRRERVKPTGFLSTKIDVPPIADQRRIVAVLAAVDELVSAVAAESAAVGRCVRALREQLLGATSGQVLPAGEAFSILIGRQRTPSRSSGEEMMRYLRSANVRDGVLDLEDVKEMDFAGAESDRFRLVPGDVLVSEGSASASAVGMTSQWSGELEGDVCFQNTLLRYRAVEGVTTPPFVAEWCQWAYESGRFREAAKGTNILHIGVKRAARMPVKIPALDAQQVIANLLRSGRASFAASMSELIRLQALRSAVLHACLSREIEIPESFDEIIGFEGVA